MTQAVSQVFFGEKINQIPLYFEKRQFLEDYIINLYDDIDRKSNFHTIFWRNNRLLPWIRVQAFRSEYKYCFEQVNRPGFEKEYGKQKCELPFSKGQFDTTDFDNSPFVEHHSFLGTQTKFWEVPNSGNTKEIRVEDTDGNSTWKTNLTEKLFQLEKDINGNVSNGWLLPPTQAIMLNLNIYNKKINTLMLFRLIVVKTEAGLFELDFQVNHSNLRMISSTEKAILYSFLTIFDLLLIIFVLIDIYDSAEKIIKEEQATAEQEKLAKEAENGTLQLKEEKQEEEDKPGPKGKKGDKALKLPGVDAEPEDEVVVEAGPKDDNCCTTVKKVLVYTFTKSTDFDKINLLMNLLSITNICVKYFGYDLT